MPREIQELDAFDDGSLTNSPPMKAGKATVKQPANNSFDDLDQSQDIARRNKFVINDDTDGHTEIEGSDKESQKVFNDYQQQSPPKKKKSFKHMKNDDKLTFK